MRTVPLLDVAPLAADRVQPFAGERPYVATGGVDDLGNLTPERVTYATRPTRADLTVLDGDVCMARMQATRKVFLLGSAHSDVILSTGFAVFRPAPDILDSRYLFHYLGTDRLQRAKDALCSGATQKAITNGNLAALVIPLPSLEEQRRVADLLDCAAALLAKRRAALAQVDVLTLAMFVSQFGDPNKNPKGWPLSTIDRIAEQVTDGEHQTPQRADQGIKLLSARNVRDGYIDFQDVDHIGPEEFDRIKRRCNPARGDVLISCSGTIGRVASVDTDEPLSLVRSVALVRTKGWVVHSKFLEHYLRTPALKALMLRRAHASGQPNLFQGPIRELPVYTPPIEMQRDFAREMASAGSLRDSYTISLAELDRLSATLQQQSFAGG